MPFVVLQEFKIEGDDRSTTNYDSVSEHIGMDTNPPDGMIIHTAGWDEEGGVLRDFPRLGDPAGLGTVPQRAAATRACREAGSRNNAPPDREASYELHNLISRG